MHLPDALAWLYSTQLFGIKPGLDNTRKLLRALQLPGSGQRFFHVAGTNGKGSTCAFLESLLRTAGHRTGLFTSPHLVAFPERIQTGGRLIPDQEAARGIDALRATVADWSPHPTFFELTFALALDWFDRAGAEVIVLETGMGGRLDATNAITPLVSVITPVSYDHQQWLGDTLTAIAGEKAGIIKPGIPVVSAPQPPEVEAVLRAAAAAAGAPLTFVPPPEIPYKLPLAGAHQQANAALAVAAAQAAGFRLPDATIRHGLAATRWPARFQELDGGRLILDGAHNPDGAARLAETWQHRFPGESARLLFGAVAAKDYRQSLRHLAAITGEARFLTVNSPRAVPAPELAAAWQEIAPAIPCHLAPSLPEALADPSPLRRLLCGSLYLCGEALALHHGTAFEPSAQ